MSGAIVAFSQFPDQWERLRKDRTLLPTAVEEMLRFVTPVMNFRRQTTEDVEIGGQTIKAGEKVVFFHVSANRDETVFEDPDRFDVARKPNPHIAFGGGGPHFCLGANLARMEIIVMFEHLLDRIFPTSAWTRPRGAPAVELHQRGEAPPRGVLALGARRGPLRWRVPHRPSSRPSSATSGATRSSTWRAASSASGARPRSPWTRSPPRPGWPGRRCMCTSPTATNCCGRASRGCTRFCSTRWWHHGSATALPGRALRTLVLNGHARAHRRQPRLLPADLRDPGDAGPDRRSTVWAPRLNLIGLDIAEP